MEQINNSVLDGSNIEASKRLDELIKEIEKKSDRPLPGYNEKENIPEI